MNESEKQVVERLAAEALLNCAEQYYRAASAENLKALIAAANAVGQLRAETRTDVIWQEDDSLPS